MSARPRASRPRASTRPGTGGRGSRRPVGVTSGAPTGAAASPVRGTRVTGRALVLVLVLAVLVVSYASSLRAYLAQRAHMADLTEQIATTEADIADLQRETDRYRDPAFIKAQARARFGYLMPGETAFVVLDDDGEPLDQGDVALSDPEDVLSPPPTAWWATAWASMEYAGHPEDGPDLAETITDGRR